MPAVVFFHGYKPKNEGSPLVQSLKTKSAAAALGCVSLVALQKAAGSAGREGRKHTETPSAAHTRRLNRRLQHFYILTDGKQTGRINQTDSSPFLFTFSFITVYVLNPH